ncbi:hypothetical protein HPB48_007176 [Haemaphysalis longicornis]|uniref:Phospholipid scramblase n=1 Tax=Haemaphysalis longicornis TaxID=44386 RepID=A0A9J6FTC3_HAELO|nr:hypothetical protein HPB48_007176 [Haemaphysalis longicornis]
MFVACFEISSTTPSFALAVGNFSLFERGLLLLGDLDRRRKVSPSQEVTQCCSQKCPASHWEGHKVAKRVSRRTCGEQKGSQVWHVRVPDRKWCEARVGSKEGSTGCGSWKPPCRAWRLVGLAASAGCCPTVCADTDCCSRNCCGPNRPFDIKLTDNAGNEVIHLQRDLRCSSCCCPCCLQVSLGPRSAPGAPQRSAAAPRPGLSGRVAQRLLSVLLLTRTVSKPAQSGWCTGPEDRQFCYLWTGLPQRLEVSSPPYSPIGYVVQEWSILTPKFRVENADGECVFKIEGPFCTWSICGDVEFKVLTKDGSVEVGRISKQWSGLLKETFTDTDNFGISFPMDLDVKMKAVLLGALFLIVSAAAARGLILDGCTAGLATGR